MYCKCGEIVHPVRLDLGYKTCVDCSTTQTYSYVCTELGDVSSWKVLLLAADYNFANNTEFC